MADQRCPGGAVGDHVGQFSLAVGPIGRYHDQAEPQTSHVGHRQVDGRRSREQQPLTVHQTRPGQTGRQAFGAIQELASGHPPGRTAVDRTPQQRTVRVRTEGRCPRPGQRAGVREVEPVRGPDRQVCTPVPEIIHRPDRTVDAGAGRIREGDLTRETG